MVTPPSSSIEYCGDIHATKAINPSQWSQKYNAEASISKARVILIYGSWNRVTPTNCRDDYDVPRWVALVKDALSTRNDAPSDVECMAFSVKADADEESLDICADGEAAGGLGAPSSLPALLFLRLPASTTSDGEGNSSREVRLEHVRTNGSALEAYLTRSDDDVPSTDSRKNLVVSSVAEAWSRLFDSKGRLLPPQSKIGRAITAINNRKDDGPATRLFIAGDRSQVGKSSICLGLLGALLNSGRYAPADLAYIKPATQCEQTQLVEEFCKHKGITSCVPVGPIVYFKGFTRAFLKGEVGETSEQLLQKASDAVDKLARNKKVVIIDGVGYPAVGSITGTDNASVAKACGRSVNLTSSAGTARSPTPVLLIGKSGVGDAVDSFNINATYFDHSNVPVIGAIFNKLSLDGFYSLPKCKEAVEMYFDKFQPDRTAFGFIPEIPSLKNAREDLAADLSEKDQLNQALETAELFVEEFSRHVNVERVVNAAKQATAKYIAEQTLQSSSTTSESKRSFAEIENSLNDLPKSKHPRPATTPEYKNISSINGNGFSLTREQIEGMASVAGAAGG